MLNSNIRLQVKKYEKSGKEDKLSYIISSTQEALRQELTVKMSAGSWLLWQHVLFFIRLERVSCGLG